VRLVIYTLFFSMLISPLLAVAEQAEPHKYSNREEIAFEPSTQVAFDRSGTQVISKIQLDGSIIAEHHGSLANITVARRGPDGTVETFCTTDASAAKAWMAGADALKPATSVNLFIEEK
jgi:hypothetical protein